MDHQQQYRQQDQAGDRVMTTTGRLSHQANLALQSLSALIEDSSLLYHLPTPKAFTALISVCKSLKRHQLTYLNFYLRPHFKKINKLYHRYLDENYHEQISKVDYMQANIILPEVAFANRLIEKCVRTGQAEVLNVLFHNLPMMFHVHGNTMGHVLDIAMEESPLSKQDQQAVVEVLLQNWYERNKSVVKLLQKICNMNEMEMEIDILIIRDKIINAVEIGDLDVVKLIWSFVYLDEVDDSSLRHKVGIRDDQVITAVGMKRFDIVDFFIKSGESCWSYRSDRGSNDNDNDYRYENDDDENDNYNDDEDDQKVEEDEDGAAKNDYFIEDDIAEGDYYDHIEQCTILKSSVVNNALYGLIKSEMEFDSNSGLFLENMLALGGSLKVAMILLLTFVKTPQWKPIFDTLIRAGFHISLASDSLIKSLSKMLVKGEFYVTEYLWECGVLDSLEFGKRIVLLLRKDAVKRVKKRGDEAIVTWTMEMVIIRAAFYKHHQFLRHLQKTGININEIAGSQSLVAATNSRVEPTSTITWLLDNANVIPSDRDLPSILNNCINNNHYNVLTQLLDRHYVTRTTLGMRLLDSLDEWILYSQVTISESCMCKGFNWLYKSQHWKFIEIEGFMGLLMSKALQAGYFILFDNVVSVLRKSGVQQIDLRPVDRMLAQGGELKLSSLSLDKIRALPSCKQILDIYVGAGFHLGIASDNFVESLNDMLMEEDVDIINFLWKNGALDSFEFGQRLVGLVQQKAVDGYHPKRRVKSKTGLSDEVKINWTMETVITTAVLQDQNQLLRHLHRTGTEINQIAGSQSLVVATSSENIENVYVAPRMCKRETDQPISSINYDKLLQTRSRSVTEFNINKVANWLIQSDYWDSIEIPAFSEQFLAKALRANYDTLLKRMLAYVGILLENVGGRWKFVRSDNAVVDIEKGTFIFSTAKSVKPLTSLATGASTSNGTGHVFGGNNASSFNGGGVVRNDSVVNVVGTEGSTLFSFSATSVGDSLRGGMGSPGNSARPQAFGAAMRGNGPRSKPGSRPQTRLDGR
ncbi:hypothetical protein HDU76_005902 [Blyttiomyces sp. JEL0837]|nr:hypothetical protein HDU76_005902 [Blyttiomyces sp. JEL0837]